MEPNIKFVHAGETEGDKYIGKLCKLCKKQIQDGEVIDLNLTVHSRCLKKEMDRRQANRK